MTQSRRAAQAQSRQAGQAEAKEYTWDDLIAAIGQDFSGGEVTVAADPIDRSMIRRYCEPLEDDCPLYYDEEVAKRHGYKGIIVPWSAVTSFATQAIWNPGDQTKWPMADKDYTATIRPAGERTERRAPPLPMPKTNAGFATDVEIEYLLPVYIGDRLSSRGRKLVSVTLRETRVGYGAFQVSEGEIINQRGEVVAKTRNGSYSYIAGAKAPK